MGKKRSHLQIGTVKPTSEPWSKKSLPHSQRSDLAVIPEPHDSMTADRRNPWQEVVHSSGILCHQPTQILISTEVELEAIHRLLEEERERCYKFDMRHLKYTRKLFLPRKEVCRNWIKREARARAEVYARKVAAKA